MTTPKLENLIAQVGEKRAVELLQQALQTKGETLSIIVDQTMHRIPSDVLSGHIYEFSKGNFSTESSDDIKLHIVERLRDLSAVLKSKNWKNVRIIVSGHALLAMQVKLLVYRILHLDTEDVAYFGKDGYKSIHIQPRKDVISSLTPSSTPE